MTCSYGLPHKGTPTATKKWMCKKTKVRPILKKLDGLYRAGVAKTAEFAPKKKGEKGAPVCRMQCKIIPEKGQGQWRLGQAVLSQ
jgi:hypothetical protein